MSILSQAFAKVSSGSAPNGIYTAVTNKTISSINVCNQDNTEHRFSVAIAVNGAPFNPAQFLYFNVPLQPNQTFFTSLGIVLDTGDVIMVGSDSALLNFTIFGWDP